MKMKIKKVSRGRGARETHQTQDYPYTPPSHTTTHSLRTRYATRSSTLVSPKVLPRSPQAVTACNPSLRSALRILKEDDEVSGCSSQPNVVDPVRENSLEYVKPSREIGLDVSPSMSIQGIGSPSAAAPFTELEIVLDISQPSREKNSDVQRHVPNVAGPFAEQDTELDVSQPSKEKSSEVQCHEQTLAKCRTEDVLPSSSRCPSQTRSFNLTEYARGLQEDCDEDLEEVHSDPNHVYVQGHRVKKEIAGLVGAIFDKHGDLTRESEVRSPEIIAIFFERVCDVYQKLEHKKLFDLTSGEINNMIDEFQFFQKGKLKVGWLLEKLQQINETKTSILKYSKIKREVEKCIEADKRIDKELEQSQRYIALMQKKMSAAQEEKIAIKAKANKYEKMALDIKAKVHALANQSLVRGLL